MNIFFSLFCYSVTNSLQSGKCNSFLYTDEKDTEFKKVEVRWEVTPGQPVPIGASSSDYISISSITVKAANSKTMK